MSSEGEIQVPFVLPLTEHSSLLPWYEAIQNNLDFFVYGQGGDDLIEHYRYLATVPGLEKVFQQFDDAGISLPANQINHLVRFTNGFLLFITYESVPHAHDIFKPAPPLRAAPVRPAGFSGFSRAGDEPLEPLAAALAQAAEAFELEWEAEALAAPLPPAPRVAAVAPGPAPGATPDDLPAEAAPDGPPARAPAPRMAHPPPFEPPARPLDRSAPPRWSVGAARAVLAGAATRDEVVLATLRYARDFFQYAALFAVTRDAVAGHDGLGPEDGTRDVVRTVALYVTDPGIFRTTLDTMAPYLGPVGRDASGSVAVLEGLGRGAPRTALVYPVLLRGRPICILYADNGTAPVSARRLGDLLLFLSMVGAAFERIIRARKDVDRVAPPAGPPPELEPPPALSAEQPEPQPEEDALSEPTPLPPELPPVPEPLQESLQESLPEPLPEPLPESLPEPLPESLPEPPPVPTAELTVAPPAPLGAPPELAAVEEAFFSSALGQLPEGLPSPPSPPPDPGALEITLERPLRPAPPTVPVDPAALVGAYLVSSRGTGDRADLLGKLVERAAEVAPILCEQLPGPLDVAPEALAATPAYQQGPVFAAVAALGPATLKPLLALLADPVPARRRAATALLGQLGDPSAFLPLTERCFDHDAAVAEAARTALGLHRRDPTMKPVPQKLRRALLSGLADKAAPAARAIAALRDAESIPLLIQALEGSDAGTAAASADALAAITMQRHGVKARDWLMWWKQNRARSRTEWLFGALTSGDRDLRLQAAGELREAAATPVSYSADLPESERQAAAQAWQRWFTQGGHRP